MSRPFDEVRYKGLLEGLEVAEVPMSGVARHKEMRVEAEFYVKKSSLLGNCRTGREIIPFTQYGTSDELNEEGEGFPVLRLNEFDASFIGEPAKCCSLLDQQSYEKLRIRKGDVLVCRTNGNPTFVGKAAVAMADTEAAFASYLFRVRPNAELISPEVLCAFLNSSVGRVEIERHSIRSNQVNFSPDKLLQLRIPLFTAKFQCKVDVLFAKAFADNETSKIDAQQAEQTLLRALGLGNWQLPEPLTYTRRASEAFTAGRLDSDYFASRVAELLQKLGEARLTIGSVAPPRHERFDPAKSCLRTPSPPRGGEGGGEGASRQAETGDNFRSPHPSPLPLAGEGTGVVGEFDYIEIGDIRADGTADSTRLPVSEAPSRATQHVRAGDIITSSVRPIRRLSAIITPEQDGFVCSSGFVVLQPRDVPAEVLLTYLRLPPLCELMDLHTSASLYPAISEADLLALPFHPIAKDAEAKIVKAIQSAHAARRKAYTLLEAAKRAVEIAIEDSEAVALGFLAEFLPANA